MMTTTPTFRVADGMLKENARMKQTRSSVGKVLGDGQMWYSPQQYYQALATYQSHLASLRSIPIAPGCVFEGDSLIEGEDFKLAEYWVRNCDRGYPTNDDIDILAVPIHKPTPPARAFSLAEALEIWDEAERYGREWSPYGKTTYFKAQFNIDI